MFKLFFDKFYYKISKLFQVNPKVRVRFAPSPTGPLHIGGVRTALYNYLFAKRHNGTFILRIEDTDQVRLTEGAESYIEKTLEWCQMLPTESTKLGGDFGPYKQSERRHLYTKYANQLLEAGKAYYAFDTPEELDSMRAEAMEKGEITKYGFQIRDKMKNSLSLSDEEVQARLKAGDPYVLRLKVNPDETIIFEDMIRGLVRFSSEEVDDKVLMKSDGMPTYHLANIVDDHLMEITHVIRGEEWLPSTPLHVLLYRYFGWEDTMPKFAHLPLILKPSPESYITKASLVPLAERLTDEFFKKNPEVRADYQPIALAFLKQVFQDKKNIGAKLKERKKDKPEKKILKEFLKDNLFGKLSKRDGDRLGFPVFPLDWLNVKTAETADGFRERGFLPEALTNFLAFLGWNPGTEQEIFTMDQLVEAFSLERVNKSGARFDFAKAAWFNQQYILKLSDEALADRIKSQVTDNGHDVTNETLVKVCSLLKERITALSEFWEQGYYFFEPVKAYDEKTIRKKWKPENRATFDQLVETVKNVEAFSAEEIETKVKAFIHDNELKFGNILPIFRVALTGTMKGPSIFEVAELLGKDAVIERFETAYTAFDQF